MLGEYHGGNFVKKEKGDLSLPFGDFNESKKYHISIERNQTSSVDHLVHNPNGSLHAEFWICLKKKNRNNVVSCFFKYNCLTSHLLHPHHLKSIAISWFWWLSVLEKKIGEQGFDTKWFELICRNSERFCFHAMHISALHNAQFFEVVSKNKYCSTFTFTGQFCCLKRI